MTNDDGRKPEGAPERSPKAGAGAPSGVDGNGPKRFSVQRKMAIVARLLRGEPLELVARETNVSIARLTEWRDRALAGAATALKEPERDDRDDEIARLKSKVGEITMDNELLCAKIAPGGQTPFGAKGRDDEPDTLADQKEGRQDTMTEFIDPTTALEHEKAATNASDYATMAIRNLCRLLDIDANKPGWREQLAPFAPVLAAMINASAADFDTVCGLH